MSSVKSFEECRAVRSWDWRSNIGTRSLLSLAGTASPLAAPPIEGLDFPIAEWRALDIRLFALYRGCRIE
jgi:hypothetical protein